mmetsp:Transcript_1030/g.3128  ORF Transcript_1030/g.3128 Transcript_1030/m.3128 type:complete len:221 (+) Transcript_1030:1025-1687(+)
MIRTRGFWNDVILCGAPLPLAWCTMHGWMTLPPYLIDGGRRLQQDAVQQHSRLVHQLFHLHSTDVERKGGQDCLSCPGAGCKPSHGMFMQLSNLVIGPLAHLAGRQAKRVLPQGTCKPLPSETASPGRPATTCRFGRHSAGDADRRWRASVVRPAAPTAATPLTERTVSCQVLLFHSTLRQLCCKVYNLVLSFLSPSLLFVEVPHLRMSMALPSGRGGFV